MPVRTFACAVALLALAAAAAKAQSPAGIAGCADERVKTAVLALDQLAAAEARCNQVLAGTPGPADRQKALFYRGLMRFLQVVQKGAAAAVKADGSAAYSGPSLTQLEAALADIEAAIATDGPMKGDALALRATVNQVTGRSSEARADIAEAMQAAPQDATPFVQRALENEKAGDVNAALADLNRALELDPAAGTALFARGSLLRRLGQLERARVDLAAAAAFGAPIRRVALIAKSQLELRAGDLRTAYEDLMAASREAGDMPKDEAAAQSAELFVRAGDLALHTLKDPDTAGTLYKEAARLAPKSFGPMLGLAGIEEARGASDKAIAIYKRIIAATRATPNLYERILASQRLKALTQPASRARSGPFRQGMDSGIGPGKASPDGLKRIAFVIGSGDYAELASLPNARRDAAVMGHALADMGFESVEVAENPGKADLRGVPAYVAERAAEADIVVVFYAGHGVETGGVNYVVPVDATLESDRELQSGALALKELTAAASRARRGALVIVDACRDDPFVEARAVAASRGGAAGRGAALPDRLHTGLAATPTPPPNNVVLHSTQPGQTAADGDGLDSPFVRSLLETLSTPGKALDEVVRDTSRRVAERTEGRQMPAAYGTAQAVPLLPRKVAR